MRLTATERKAQILKTAAQLFAEQGYEGTKTSQIAREAGVNEAIIFRHFTNKEELYWAVLLDMCTSRRAGERMRAIVEAGGTPEQVLARLASDILGRNFADPKWWRLLLYAALENHKLSHRFFRSYVAGYYEELASYIRTQARAGVFRSDVDAVIAARGFLGMIIYHFQIQELFGGKTVQNIDVQTVSEAFGEMWASALRAGSNAKPLPNGGPMAAMGQLAGAQRNSSGAGRG
jgi:TetR/AcrR family transcriptional regulator